MTIVEVMTLSAGSRYILSPDIPTIRNSTGSVPSKGLTGPRRGGGGEAGPGVCGQVKARYAPRPATTGTRTAGASTRSLRGDMRLRPPSAVGEAPGPASRLVRDR